MSKDKLTDYDATASNNSDVGGVNTAEGMLPSKVNDAIRELMSHLADFSAGTTGVDVLNLQDDDNSASIKIQAPSELTTTTTFTLPDGDGSAGQALLTDGAGALAWQSPASPNLIINGNMAVAQYGANNLNITSASGGTFACDRFKFYLSLGGTAQFDLQQVAEAPTGSGFSNSLKVSCDVTDTLTAGNYLFIEYNIEGQDLQRIKKGTSDAESLTLSFWLKSNKTASGQVNVRDHDNTRLISKTYTVSSADTWQYVTLTFDGDTTGVITNDNTKGLSLEFFLDSGTTYSSGATPANWEALSAADRNATSFGLVSSTDNYWQITGVQLEVGTVANPVFQHESYGETLQKCQRYYNRLGVMVHQFFSSSVGSSNPDLQDAITFPPMRDAPDANPYTDSGYTSSGSTNTTNTTLSLSNIGISSLTSKAQRSGSGATTVRTSYYLELVSEL